MFLVHDDQPQGFQGGKNSGSGPHHDRGFPRLDASPLIQPLPGGKTAVEDSYFFTKPGTEAPFHLGHQTDFRYQDQGLTVLGEGFLRRPQIYFRFPRTGDSVKKQRLVSSVAQCPFDFDQGLLLLSGQINRPFFNAKNFPQGVSKTGLFPDLQQAFPTPLVE